MHNHHHLTQRRLDDGGPPRGDCPACREQWDDKNREHTDEEWRVYHPHSARGRLAQQPVHFRKRGEDGCEPKTK